jgi:uncharacterized protein YdaU (DUF1376 family)
VTELPAPLVPPEVDLSRLDGFMLNTVRLLGSELVALSTGDEFKAALLLWCRAWKQRPACSLPDDDRILASFAGNLPLARWKKIKTVALRGFVKCADGRLYHRVLAEDAIRAAKAQKQRQDAIRKRWERPPEGPDDGTKSIRPNDARTYDDDTKPIPTVSRDETRQDVREGKNASSATESSIAKPLSLGGRASNLRKIGSVISGSGSPKWGSQQARDEFAVAACVPFLPGRDDGERWSLALAAEDPESGNHDEACRAMRKAAEQARVGWVSPERRQRDAGAA